MNIGKDHKTKPRHFKTPGMKLVRFFEKSRDQWKSKAKDAKYQIKLLRKKIKYMEENKKITKRPSKISPGKLNICKRRLSG